MRRKEKKTEQIPFTCKVTNKYVDADIMNIFIYLEDDIIKTIPVSPYLSDSTIKKAIKEAELFIIERIRSINGN